MTRAQCITTLRTALTQYSRISPATLGLIDMSDATFYIPYAVCNGWGTTDRDTFRAASFPLYYAIHQAAAQFKRSCPDGDLLARTIHKNRHHTKCLQIQRLLSTCLDVLESK